MSKHWQYFKYVARHKWFVFLAGLQMGVPIWRLILHDWTKFLPREWMPYVEQFHGDKPPQLGKTGYSHQFDSQQSSFNNAWNHHQNKNDHHWQYWIIPKHDGNAILPMPDVCRREMVADWMGAGRAQGKPDISAWYVANRDKMLLHPETRDFIDVMLDWMSEMPEPPLPGLPEPTNFSSGRA